MKTRDQELADASEYGRRMAQETIAGIERNKQTIEEHMVIIGNSQTRSGTPADAALLVSRAGRGQLEHSRIRLVAVDGEAR